MTTYGSIPGVRITTSTGRISGVTIGRAQYLLMVGIGGIGEDGEPEGEAEANEIVAIEGNAHSDEQFGEDSDLANAYRRAIANGVNPDFIRGVRAEVSAEEESLEQSGTLAETPILADESLIEIEGEDDYEVVFDYNDPTEIAEEGELHINPYTGEYDADDSGLDIVYHTADWETAMDQYKDELVEGEFGVITPLTSASSVASQMQSTINQMREDLKLVVGVMGAEYNDTYEGKPWLDVSEFESSFSDDTMWIVGPTELDNNRAEDRGVGGLSAVAGLFAGNATTEPVYDSTIDGITGLEQRITRSDVADLRDEYIVPLRDSGTIRIEDNHSTYDQDTDGGWERDFFRRRVVDLTMATMYLIARRQIGGILDSDTVDDVEDAVTVELSDLVDDGLLEPNGQEVDVYRADDRTIGLDLTITPLGVAKGAEIDLQINA